jgi:hypothetical protein
MAWSSPQYSRARVDWAGRVLIGRESGDQSNALQIINNWRGSHSFPLNTFQMGLRNRSRQVDREALVAQRIKRLSSIEEKLRRERSMQLSQMQDIGGCRAVLPGVAQVCAVRDSFLQSRVKHRLAKQNDYIADPKVSGYRGIHLVYRYVSDKKDTYNGLQIEVQIRSQLQHAWATAVETVGTFLEQSLKASQGSEEWLHFFVLMGSAIALREKTALVPRTPTSRPQLVREIKQHMASLDVESRLAAYHATIPLLTVPEVKGAKYFLVELRPADRSVSVTPFREKELPEATQRYLEVERALKGPGAEAVLVSVESIDALRRAYPNYFLDTRLFIAAMKAAVS